MPPQDPNRDSESLSLTCPLCAGKMELVYDRPSQKVFVCTDCHSGITIPVAAWQVQAEKLGNK